MALETRKLDLEEAKNIRDNQTKLTIKEMELTSNMESTEDNDDDGVMDVLELEKLQLQRQKQKEDLQLKIRDLDDRMKMHLDKMEKEDKKIAVSRIQKKKTT